MAELAHCIIVDLTQELGICFFDKGILVWNLFSLEFLMPMLRYLIYLATKILYCVVLLNGITRKGYIISIKHFLFEKRMELV